MLDTVKDLVRQHPRFGYRRLGHMLLRQARVAGRSAHINAKRVHRLCRVAVSSPRFNWIFILQL